MISDEHFLFVFKPKYISLQEASKGTPYSQEYLSLLARRGKLFSVKLGRNWYTTQEAIDDYLKKQSITIAVPKNLVRQKQIVASLTQSLTPEEPEAGENLPAETLVKAGHEQHSKIFEEFERLNPQVFLSQDKQKEGIAPIISQPLPPLTGEISSRLGISSGVLENKIDKLADSIGVFAEKITTKVSELPETIVSEEEKEFIKFGSGSLFYRLNKFNAYANSLVRSPVRMFAVMISAIVMLFILAGGFSFGQADYVVQQIKKAFKDADTLGGHFPGTHANEVLVLDKAGNISIFGHIETQGQLRSHAPDGVAPIVVDSVTKVENLNADYLDDLDSKDFTLAFVTKNGNITYEDVYLEGNVEVGKTLTVKGAAKLLDSLQVYGSLGVFGDAVFGKDITLTSGTIRINNTQMIKNLNAEMLGGIKKNDINLDFVTSNGATTSNGITVGGLEVNGQSDFNGAGFFHQGVWGSSGAFGSLGVKGDASIGNKDRPEDSRFVVFSKKFKVDDSGNLTVSAKTTTSDLVVNNKIISDLVPSGSFNLGSQGNKWSSIFVSNFTASGSVNFAGVASSSFVINTDNTTADAENSYLAFERGSITPNAKLTWDSASKSFDFNEPIRIASVSSQVHTGTWPNFSNVSKALLLISPSNSLSDGNLIIARVGSSAKFLVDNEGDIFGNNLVLAGSTTQGTTTVAGDLLVEGNTRLGDASSDKIYLVGTIVPKTLTSIPLVIKASASQTADLFRINDPNDNRILTFDFPSGLLISSSGFNFALGQSTATVSYSRLGTSTTTHSNYISRYNDLFISGDLEGRGSLSFAGTASLSNTLWVSPGGFSGNVGIGTTSPGAVLDVNGQEKIEVNAGSGFSGGGQLLLKNGAGDYSTFIGTDTYGLDFATRTNDGNGAINFYFGSGTTGIHFQGGLVSTISGVGQTLDLSNADAVKGASNQALTIQSDDALGGSNGIIFNRTNRTSAGNNAIAVFQYDGAEKARFTTSGNVGIGTTSPTSLLTVQGRGEFQGTASASYLLTGNTLQVGGFASAAYSRFGTATTGHGLSVAQDLLLSGKLEVDGTAYFDGTVNFPGVASASVFYAQPGTAASPSFSFNIDQDTGMFRPSVNQLGFSTLGNERIRIDSGGNVGIGTTGPLLTLHVKSSSTGGAPANSGTTPTGRARLDDTSNIAIDFGAIQSSPFPAWIQAHDSMNQATNYPLVLNPNGGNVGIGTTGPGAKLDVTSSGADVDAFQSIGNSDGSEFLTLYGGRTNNTNSDIFWNSNNTRLGFGPATNKIGAGFSEKLSITTGGNVGIGSTSPTGKLDIVGDLTGNTNPLLRVASTSDLFRVQENGNVGIGTTGPLLTLHVKSSSTGGAPANSGTTPTGRARLDDTSNIAIDFGAIQSSPFPAWIQAHDSMNQATNYPLVLNPNGGNVGIGTTGPGALLHTYSTSIPANGVKVSIAATSTSIGNAPALTLEQLNGTNNNYIETRYLDGVATAVGYAGMQITSHASHLADFFWATGTTERMRITSGGNVGIGTTAVTNRLHVDFDSTDTTPSAINNPTLRLSNYNTTDGNYSGIMFNSKDTGGTERSGAMIAGISSSHGASMVQSELGFYTRNINGTVNDVMRLDENGNVGIGTTGPGTLLDISKSGDTVSTGGVALSNVARLAGTFVTSDSTQFNLVGSFYGNQTAATTNSIQGVEGFVHTSHGTGTVSLAIGTIGNAETTGAGTTTTLRGVQGGVQIRSTGGGTDAASFFASPAGRVGAGSGTYTNGYGLLVGSFGTGFTNKYAIYTNDGNVRLGGPVFMVGLGAVTDDRSVCASSTTGELEFVNGTCGTSSIRYKENIRELGYSLDEIKRLNPVFFNYIKDSTASSDYSLIDDRTKRRVGFIAEEMQKIIPEVVIWQNGQIENIDYPSLTALLTRGVQELDAKYTSLSLTVDGLLAKQASGSSNITVSSSGTGATQVVSATTDILGTLANTALTKFQSLWATGDIVAEGIKKTYYSVASAFDWQFDLEAMVSGWLTREIAISPKVDDMTRSLFSGTGVQAAEESKLDLKDPVTSSGQGNGAYLATYGVDSARGEVYLSGSSQISGGEAKIYFDFSFTSVISDKIPLKVLLTPTTSMQGQLYVANKTPYGFVVKSLNGPGDGKFDWLVIARRRGYEGNDVLDNQKTAETAEFGESSSGTQSPNLTLNNNISDTNVVSSGSVDNLFSSGPEGNRTPETQVSSLGSSQTGPTASESYQTEPVPSSEPVLTEPITKTASASEPLTSPEPVITASQ